MIFEINTPFLIQIKSELFFNNRKSNFCHTTDICKQQLASLVKVQISKLPQDAGTSQPIQTTSHETSSDSDPLAKIPSIKEMDALLPKRNMPFPDQIVSLNELMKGKKDQENRSLNQILNLQ